jgi:nucleotidyltransferase/DNA polymerase involved in DNA repair
MTPTQYVDDILSRRYSAVCLHADRQLAAAARAADRAEILEHASREMELVQQCQQVIARCNLGGAGHG